jgi:hypothetical protein
MICGVEYMRILLRSLLAEKRRLIAPESGQKAAHTCFFERGTARFLGADLVLAGLKQFHPHDAKVIAMPVSCQAQGMWPHWHVPSPRPDPSPVQYSPQ